MQRGLHTTIDSQELESVRKQISEIPDPEIPVITIADLGILREIKVENEKIVVVITPTYNGCPAMKTIENEIRAIMNTHSILDFEIIYTYSPAWTTDWISDSAKERLRMYGIAPPGKASADKNSLLLAPRKINCPRCHSSHTELISQFGSTACKALYRCIDCREPFDYFKCH
ncbi:MAG: phenylacetate-CoA oxygenase subunit PaaJ [Bacteroidetes bacterium]|nr:phenylacetate-CoA oxygenase subunit PaaJ [Bacteroidota bacterium]